VHLHHRRRAQWLRDGLGIIGSAARRAGRIVDFPDNGGVFMVLPLSAWRSVRDPYARGTIAA